MSLLRKTAMPTKNVIVELRVPEILDPASTLDLARQQLRVPGFSLDPEYQPVPVSPRDDLAAQLTGAHERVVLVRGQIEESQEEVLRRLPGVIGVWTDSRVEGFTF
jgi:hypothetical protein